MIQLFNYAILSLRYRDESRKPNPDPKAADRPPFGPVGLFRIKVRVSGPKFEIFWLGLGLGYIMVCDLTLVCVHVRNVMLIRELDQLAARIGSLKINPKVTGSKRVSLF